MTSPSALEREEFDALVQGVDLVCITDSDRDFIVSRRWVSRTPRRRRGVGSRRYLYRFVRMMLAEGQKSRCMRGGLMASSVTYFVICWSMNTSLRMCFSDLVVSTLVEDSAFGHSDRSGAKRDGGKDVRVKVSYSPLREALKHRWSGITRRQTKGMNPAAVFIILGRHKFFVGLDDANDWTQ
jgi:ubiquitin-like 1-activating enzyme E1 A